MTKLRYLPQYEELDIKSRARDYVINGISHRRVSTMLGIINKPALMPWSQKTMANWLTDHLRSMDARRDLYNFFTSDYADMDFARPPMTYYDEQLKGKWGADYDQWVANVAGGMRDSVNKTTEKAADRGHEVHALLCSILAQLPDTNDIKFAIETMVDPQSDVDARVIDGLQFILDNSYTVAGSEMVVWDDNTKLAGTLDLAAYAPDGRLVIWDWKTGSGPWWEMALQLGAYAGMLKNVTGEYPADAYIVKLTDSGVDSYRIADPATNECALPDATHAFFQAVGLKNYSDKHWFEGRG